MSPLAILATQMQMEVARDLLQHPEDPRYEWALRFIEVYGRNGRRAMRDARGRFIAATKGKQSGADRRAVIACDLWRDGWNIDAIRYQLAIEEKRPKEPYDRRTVQRLLRRGGIPSPTR